MVGDKLHKKEGCVIIEMRKIVECDTEKLGTSESCEKTVAILGDRWWPQTAKQEKDKISKYSFRYYMEESC